ncbi:MAG: hypothetical protein JWP03_4817 [Phycisphaerales bacterium]|nr:hypothetical protein [Phycisphaerales bacterium]
MLRRRVREAPCLNGTTPLRLISKIKQPLQLFLRRCIAISELCRVGVLAHHVARADKLPVGDYPHPTTAKRTPTSLASMWTWTRPPPTYASNGKTFYFCSEECRDKRIIRRRIWRNEAHERAWNAGRAHLELCASSRTLTIMTSFAAFARSRAVWPSAS